MRSRYTAYVRGDVPYIVATTDASTRAGVDAKALALFCQATVWRGLEIVATELGGADDVTGVVEFVARGETVGAAVRRLIVQRERSRFRKVDGHWFYIDGDLSRGAR